MKSTIKSAMFAAALVFGAASISLAQVKVGANPTVIGTNSNLEVEAANGNKTIVNKATGQVTIQDGTQGAGKVLVSDANGASSWQSGVPSAPNAEVMVSARLTIPQTLLGNTITKVNFDVESFDKNNNFDLASDELTAPSNGYYLVNVGFERNTNEPNALYAFIYINGADTPEGALWTQAIPTSGWATTGTRIMYLNAGDKVDIRMMGEGTTGMRKAALQIAKISN